jgi:hypothetical protein
MTLDEIATYNDDWLNAWTQKDVEQLAAFYAEDCVYMDTQTTGGLRGRPALRAYLERVFAAAPAMTYAADQVWAIEGGFCGRWFCDMPGGVRRRGFDLVLLRGREIILNEVYVHTL